MQRRDCHEFAGIEAGQGRVDEVFRPHRRVGCFLRRIAGNVPELGGGGGGQHGLDAHALLGQILLQRVAEAQDIGFRGAVDAIEVLDRDGHRRRDVDDGTLAAGHEGGGHCIGQAGQGSDVDVDHRLHRVDVGLQDRGDRADAGIVDQHGDAGIVAEHRFHLGEVRLAGEIRRKRGDLHAGFGAQALGRRLEALRVARHQDQVVAAPRVGVGLDGSDAGRRPGDKGRAARGSVAHRLSPFSWPVIEPTDRDYGCGRESQMP